MKKYIASFLVTISLIVGVGLTSEQTVSAQSASTYSCGVYGSGTYNNADCTGTVTPPNTGFARILQPDYLLPIVGFAAAIVLGAFLVYKTRKQQR